MSKVKSIDTDIANTIRDMRTRAGLTQPQVASYLGIAYQSYQKMEGGKVSFRLSTLEPLASLYGITICDIVGKVDPPVDPDVTKFQVLLVSMTAGQREEAYEATLKIKHGG